MHLGTRSVWDFVRNAVSGTTLELLDQNLPFSKGSHGHTEFWEAS